MFNNLKSSWALFSNSFKVFGKYPVLLAPIVMSWVFYAPIVLWLQFFAPWDSWSAGQALLVIFLVLWAFALLLSLSCAWVLELIQQIESGRQPELGPAWGEVMTRDLKVVLPLSLVWAVVWFILTILEALFSRRKKGDSDNASLNAENAARTLGGDGAFSWISLGFRLINKAIRMFVFLILPAVAWEDKSVGASVKRGYQVLKRTLTQFVAGFALTEAAAALIFIPPAIMFTIADKGEVTFPDWVWYLTILYTAIATSYSIYLEQMYTAELYMWYLFWERAVADAEAKGLPAPKLTDVAMPTLLDGVPDLMPVPEPPAPTPTVVS